MGSKLLLERQASRHRLASSARRRVRVCRTGTAPSLVLHATQTAAVSGNLFPTKYKAQYKPLDLISPNHLRLIRESMCERALNPPLNRGLSYLARCQCDFPSTSGAWEDRDGLVFRGPAVCHCSSPHPTASSGNCRAVWPSSP